MARIRFVKPEFFTDAKVVKLRAVVRLFYIGLFTQADRCGRFLWNDDDLKIKLIPYDRDTGEKCLDELLKSGRIFRYGKHGEYGLIINFLKHQYINPREPDSKIPAPNKDEMALIEKSYTGIGQSDTGILDLGLRIKDKGEREAKKPEASVDFLKNIPTEILFEWYQRFDCSKKGIINKGEELWNYCKSKGKVYKDYKALMLNALKKDFPERDENHHLRRSQLVEVDGVMKILPKEMQGEYKNLADKMKIKHD